MKNYNFDEMLKKNINTLKGVDVYSANLLSEIKGEIDGDYSSCMRIESIINRRIPFVKVFRYCNDIYDTKTDAEIEKFIACMLNGLVIQLFIKASGLPRTKLAISMDLHPGTVYSYMRGYGYMSDKCLDKIVSVLNNIEVIYRDK